MNIQDYQEDFTYTDADGKPGIYWKGIETFFKSADEFIKSYKSKGGYCLRCQGICRENKHE